MNTLRKSQTGLAMVEFAIVGAVFFMALFGVLEVGRLLYTWNVLDEVTRRGARLASVCPVTQGANIRQRATFNGTLLHGLTPANVQLQYLNNAGAVIADPVGQFADIVAVRVSITGFTHQFLVPFAFTTLTAPAFSVTAAAESLGVSPVGTGVTSC